VKISRKCKEPLGRKAWAFGRLDSGRFAASFADGTGQALHALKIFGAARGQQRNAILLLDKAEDLQETKRIDFAGGNQQFGFGDAAFRHDIAGDEFRQIVFDAHAFFAPVIFSPTPRMEEMPALIPTLPQQSPLGSATRAAAVADRFCRSK